MGPYTAFNAEYVNQLVVNEYRPLNSISDFRGTVKEVLNSVEERRTKLENLQSDSE
jgi:hypothetical protein